MFEKQLSTYETVWHWNVASYFCLCYLIANSWKFFPLAFMRANAELFLSQTAMPCPPLLSAHDIVLSVTLWHHCAKKFRTFPPVFLIPWTASHFFQLLHGQKKWDVVPLATARRTTFMKSAARTYQNHQNCSSDIDFPTHSVSERVVAGPVTSFWM